MGDKIRFLHIEDNPLDAELVESELRSEWPDCKYDLICSEIKLLEALDGGGIDVILADYSLPDFDGMTALGIVMRESPETPYIFVTGAMGEEKAIETLKSGATDYVIKSHLSKLNPAIIRALRDKVAIAEHKKAELELKRNYERLELMQEVNQYHASTMQDLLDFALDKVIALTDSRIGYIYHYNEDTREFTLNTWSKDVMASCRVAEPQSIYQLEKTGLWGEVVRQRESIIVNDFDAPDPLKKGYPEGHVHLSRFLSIPVIENDRIFAVVAVANKSAPYDQTDLMQLKLMMEGVWKIATKLELEEKILHAGREWQSTFDAISDCISLIDPEQRIIRCNRSTSTVLGLDYADIVGQPCWKLFHGADGPIPDCPMAKARLSHKSEVATIKNTDIWLEVTVDPIFSDSDVLTSAVHIVRDVTDRINLNNSILEARDLFRQFMKYSPIYTYIKEVIGTESVVIEASDNFLDLVGIHSEDMIGKNMHQLFPKEFADKITLEDRQVADTKRVQRLEEHFNEGTYITYKFPIDRNDGRQLLAGYTIDITDRKRAEQELLKLLAEAQRLRTALDTVSSNIYMKNTQSRYVYANRPMLEMLGCSVSDLGSFRDESFFSSDLMTRMRDIDSRVFDGEMTAGEHEFVGLDGRRRIFWETKTPIYEDPESKKIWGLLGISSEITDLKDAETSLRELQGQLLQQDKLATIGQLAAGVAHEINNPIGFVGSNMTTLVKYIEKYNSYIELLEKCVRDEADGVLPALLSEARTSMKLDYVIRDINVLLEESNEGIERVKRIVRDLKLFSRADSSTVGTAILNDCLDSTINIIINEVKYVAELKKDYSSLPKVKCNIQQINQVFMNLLINAAHAIEAKGEGIGEITVCTWSDNENVLISVSDTGCGIPPENMSKIFDAFFTTKEVGKGTGLGLSISQGIIKKHGGDIMVKSEVGVGSTFTVRLPIKPPE